MQGLESLFSTLAFLWGSLFAAALPFPAASPLLTIFETPQYFELHHHGTGTLHSASTYFSRSEEEKFYASFPRYEQGAAYGEVATSFVGDRKVALLLYTTSDKNNPDISTEMIRRRYFDEAPARGSVQSYVKAVSYGKVRLVGDRNQNGDVFGPFTIDAASCEGGVCGPWDVSHIVDAFLSAEGVDLSRYEHLVYINAGLAPPFHFVSAPWVLPPRSWVPGMDLQGHVHEFMHQFGVDHAWSVVCEREDIATYDIAFDPPKGKFVDLLNHGVFDVQGDPYDVMGEGFVKPLNVAFRESLGWIPQDRILEVKESGTYRLAPVEEMISKSEPIALTIRKPDTKDTYYISYDGEEEKLMIRTGRINFAGGPTLFIKALRQGQDNFFNDFTNHVFLEMGRRLENGTQEVRVNFRNGFSDLVVESVSPSVPRLGVPGRVSAKILNQVRGVSSSPTTAHFTLYKNVNDTWELEKAYGPQAVGVLGERVLKQNVMWRDVEITTPGYYKFEVCVGDQSVKQINDCSFQAFFLDQKGVAPLEADLIVEQFRITTVASGTLNAFTRVKNSGGEDINSQFFNVIRLLRLGDDKGSEYLQSAAPQELKKGRTISKRFDIRLRANDPLKGIYEYSFCADKSNPSFIKEAREDNNCVSGTVYLKGK